MSHIKEQILTALKNGDATGWAQEKAAAEMEAMRVEIEQLRGKERAAFMAGWDAGQNNAEAKWMDQSTRSRHDAFQKFKESLPTKERSQNG